CTPTAMTQCGTDGDDEITVTNGRAMGGPGNDIIHVIVDPDTGQVIADGGPGDDRFLLTIEDGTNDAPITFLGRDGEDDFELPINPGVVEADAGGGPHNDTMHVYVPEPDARRVLTMLRIPSGRYSFSGGTGNDTAFSGLGRDLLLGEGGRDRMFGGGGPDNIRGGNGNDTLRGNSGVNVLSGGTGTDTCISDNRRDKLSSCERARRNH
ncbi:MAG: calcium-binding protein, partial [Actinomycetota bacterium]